MVALVVKNQPANAGDTGDVGSIPGSRKSPGEGNSNPLQNSCLENPTNRGAWQATVHRVTKSLTWLEWRSMHTLSSEELLCGHHWTLPICILFSLLAPGLLKRDFGIFFFPSHPERSSDSQQLGESLNGSKWMGDRLINDRWQSSPEIYLLLGRPNKNLRSNGLSELLRLLWLRNSR